MIARTRVACKQVLKHAEGSNRLHSDLGQTSSFPAELLTHEKTRIRQKTPTEGRKFEAQKFQSKKYIPRVKQAQAGLHGFGPPKSTSHPHGCIALCQNARCFVVEKCPCTGEENKIKGRIRHDLNGLDTGSIKNSMIEDGK